MLPGFWPPTFFSMGDTAPYCFLCCLSCSQTSLGSLQLCCNDQLIGISDGPCRYSMRSCMHIFRQKVLCLLALVKGNMGSKYIFVVSIGQTSFAYIPSHWDCWCRSSLLLKAFKMRLFISVFHSHFVHLLLSP